VIVTGVLAVTGLVFTIKAALLAPPARDRLGGTVAADALLERFTVTP